MSRYYRQEQYTEINGEMIDDKSFEMDAELWSRGVASEMKANIDSMMPHQKYSLRNSVKPKLIKKAGYIENVSFGFWRSGIFQAYGVGRGYIHTEMGVIRGHKSSLSKEKHSANKFHFSSYGVQSMDIKRKPNDWFDTVVSDRIDSLADLVASYYGDRFVLAASAGVKIIK